MGYENKIPNLGKTVQSVRDTDFISITEVKAFDKLIDEIVSKLSVISDNSSSDANEALNIAQEIKRIEFNMADAINPDGSLNISSTPDPVTGEVGGPVYGEYSMDQMLIKLDNLYNRFTKIVGEHGTEWKIDLDNYYNTVFNDFKNTVNSIFGNSVNSEAIEEKENSKYDYTKRSAVKLESNEIMRLNPDVTAYPRSINILLSKPNTDVIAFEVNELEANNLVLNLKFLNGKNYFSYNIIIDNDELFITKEESFKYNNYTYIIKLFKYNINNSNKYIVTLSSDCSDITVKYGFKIEGLLVGTYDFSTSGFNLSDHKNSWNYELVDKNVVEVPEYDVEYWYKEEIPISDINETSSESFNWKNVKGLRYWDEKEYYIRQPNFVEIGRIEIDSNEDSGTVNLDNKDINGKDITNETYSTIINKKKYTKPLYYTKVDLDTSEIFKGVGNRENFIKNNKFYRLDEGAKFIHSDNDVIYEKRDGKRNIDGNIILASGNRIISLGTIKSKSYVEFNDTESTNVSNELFIPIEDQSLYVDFTDNSDGHLNETALKNNYGEDNIIVPVILDFVDFFVKKLTMSSNNNYLYGSGLQTVIHNTSEKIVDGIKLFVDLDNVVYVMPKYNKIIHYVSDDNELIKDISILVLKDGIYRGITNDVISFNYKLINFTNDLDDSYNNLDLSKYKLVIDSEYSKLIDFKTESKGISNSILEYDFNNKRFIKDSILRDLLLNVPYIECIKKVDVRRCIRDDSLLEFNIVSDNNNENDGYKFIYNNGENDVEFPNIMNRKDYTSTKEIPMSFISTTSNEHLIYSINNNGKLYYSTDGSSWKEESRVDYDKFDSFSYIEYDKESLWFALCHSTETDKIELVYSQNGYDWDLVERGNIIGSNENIIKFKNVAINRYFLGTDKYAYFSEDGINWIKTNIPTGEWRDCAWNTKKIVIIGSVGAYQVLDGTDINSIANGFVLCTGSSGDWNNVATYEDYCFVICGKSGAKYSDSNYLSESGIMSFTRNSDIGFVRGSGFSLANNKLFVSSYNQTNDYSGFIDEHNIFQWHSNITNVGIYSVSYSPILKIYVGGSIGRGLWYSYDGRYWMQSNITAGYIEKMYYDDTLSLFISGNNDKIVYSTDGRTWSDSNITSGIGLVKRIHRFKDYICLGTNIDGDYYSTDGKTWTRGSITSSSQISGFASNDTTLVAAGNTGLYYTTSTPDLWKKCSAGNNINFTSVIYDETNNKFYASANRNNDIYISSDGVNWSIVTTPGPKGFVASNGKIILAFSRYFTNDIQTPPHQAQYSIDGGQTWSDIRGLPDNIASWGIVYNEVNETWYSAYINNTKGIVYSKNGIDWQLLFEPTPTSFTGETKLISTHAEDDTSEYVLGYFFIINGKDIHRSRDGHYWQKISYNSNITGLSSVGKLTNRDAFLCLEDKGILVSTRNDEVLNGKFSTYGEYFKQTSITDGTYNGVIQTINSDTNNTAYIAQSSNSDTKSIRINESKNSYIPITFKTGDKISFIGDIGDNELIAVDNIEYLNYDRYDRAFTPNVTVGNRNINFIKRITDKTTVLGLDTSLVFTTELNNNVYTKSDISVSDIIVTTNGIYGLNNSTGMFEITNPDSSEPVFTEVFSTLSTYNIRNIFEYSNRDLLFIAYKDSKYTIFRKKYDETTIESLGEFAGAINYVDLIDDKLILLAHGLNNGTEVNYIQNIFFNNSTNEIVIQELIDAEKILNFNKVIKYKGELFVFNKLEETDNQISINFGKLILNGDGTLALKNSDNGIIVCDKNNYNEDKYPKWNGFIYNDKLYFYNYCEPNISITEDIKNKGLFTIEDTDSANGWNIIKLDNLLSETFDKLFTDELVVQETLDNSLIIPNENFRLDIDSDSKLYKNDKIYFDKETEGLILGKYRSNGRFNLYTETVTAVKSETGDNINVALALGPDAKIALYDKEYDFLKVLDFKYIADINGSGIPHYLNISDSNEAVITNIYSGTKESENWLYFVVKDKFNTVTHDDYGNFVVGVSDTVSLRLFRTTVSSIKADIKANNEKITCEWISDITGLDNIENIKIAFSKYGITKTEPLVISNSDLQFLISGKNLKYPNVDSIASFNTNTACLIITSKIIWDSKFVDIIDQSEDINNELNYTKSVICSYDYNKTGKLDDNGAISSFLLLNTEPDGTIEHTYITDKPNNSMINIGKRIFNTCKSGIKYTNSGKNTTISSRYPSNYLSSTDVELESTFVPSKIIETKQGGLIIDTVSTSNINNGGYLVNKYNEKILLDKFSDGNVFYYNDAKDTEIGLFRWFNSSLNSYKPNEFLANSDARNTGWLYFTPKNCGRVIRIDLGPNNYVYNIFETYAGIFISARNVVLYGDNGTANKFELYRLKNIPNTIEMVQMGDSRYFQKCECGNDPVIDLKDTSEGIFMIAFYSTRTRVFKWNGEDFYLIRTDLNYTTGIKRIFDTSVGVFFIGNKAEWGLLKYIPSSDRLVHTKYKVYLNNWMSTVNIDSIETERGIYVTGTKSGTTNNKVIWDLRIDKCKELGDIGDIGLPKEIKIYPYPVLDENGNETGEYEFFTYNNYFKKLSEKISESYDLLPMDTWVKTVGNININGIDIPIKGMKLVSGEGVGNDEPDNVIFSIDQNARFNEITSKLIDLPKDGNISGTIL